MRFTPKPLKDNVNVSKRSPLKEFFILTAVALVLLILSYVVLGFAVDWIVPYIPIDVEKRIGALFADAYLDADTTSPQALRLQSIFDQLLRGFSEKEREYKVYIVSDPQVNALAVPGGVVVVFSGLVDQAESENQLAFVLGHELGHFANHDQLRSLGRSLVLTMISNTVLGLNNPVTRFFMDALQIVDTKFSQQQELRADFWALDLLQKQTGNVAGARSFLEAFSEKEQGNRLSYYFATHPYPKDRIKAIEAYIKAKGYEGKRSPQGVLKK